MRRILALVAVSAAVLLAGCGGGGSGDGSGSGGTTATTPPTTTASGGGNMITDPINRARAVAGQQSEQQRQLDQQTGSDSPTGP